MSKAESHTVWHARYLDHPLVSCAARRLLWRFTDGECVRDAIWLDGQLVEADDQPLECSEATIVSPWHPILCDADTVLKWRTWLEQHEITQPFKQAHREVYLLTDAERTTRVYSNRFAAHILRQHQFHALATGRGWRNQLRLMVDDDYAPATLELPHWGLRAEFWVEGPGEEYGVDTNETGTYLYLATDQVRFYRIGAARNVAHAGGGGYRAASYLQQPEGDSAPLPLEHIPPLVLSEVLRDVDLFVGVASVGTIPPGTMGDTKAAIKHIGTRTALANFLQPQRRASTCLTGSFPNWQLPSVAPSRVVFSKYEESCAPIKFIWDRATF